MIKLNFLPWRKRLRQKEMKIFLLLLGMLCLNIGFVLLFSFHYLHSKTSEKQKTLSTPLPTQSEQILEETNCQNKNCLLTGYSFSKLRLVGNLISNKHQWAFIAVPDGSIVKVQQGDLIGKERGRIKTISPSSIELMNGNEHKILRLKPYKRG